MVGGSRRGRSWVWPDGADLDAVQYLLMELLSFRLRNAFFRGKTKITLTTLAAAANRRPSRLSRLNNIVTKELAVGAEEAVSGGRGNKAP